MKLWIVEKPDVAKHLAAGLCRALGCTIDESAGRKAGYFQLSNGQRVLWLYGHLLDMAPVSEYVSSERQRSGDHFAYLPLIPEQFIYQPRRERDSNSPSRQYQVAIAQIKAAKEIVNAGDIDREGQLIVDELLTQAGIDPGGERPMVWRLPLASTNEQDLRNLLAKPLMRNGDARWVRKRMAALTRQRGDWMLGMTASMAWQTISGMRALSVGRVQTPVLSLVAQRDRSIETFKPQDYFVPVITLQDGTQMRWHRREGSEGAAGFDDQGRITSKAVADEIVRMINGGFQGRISKADSAKHSEAPPLPFSLGTLQSTAARQHGLSLDEITRAAQTLYERHKSISYVGTDCRYLPKSMLADAERTLKNLSQTWPKQAGGAHLDIAAKAFDDSKIDEHHAIVPTGVMPPSSISPAERAVFETISKRYMAQFYPDYVYLRHRLQALFGKDEFRASTKEVVRAGWRAVENDTDFDHQAEHESEGEGEVQSPTDRSAMAGASFRATARGAAS